MTTPGRPARNSVSPRLTLRVVQIIASMRANSSVDRSAGMHTVRNAHDEQRDHAESRYSGRTHDERQSEQRDVAGIEILVAASDRRELGLQH